MTLQDAVLNFSQDDKIEGLSPNVIFAYLFGSMARREQSRLSDIDIAVYLHEECDYASEKLNIIAHLSEKLGTDRFDLVILNNAPLISALAIFPPFKALNLKCL